MYALIVFLPLIAACIAGFGGRWLGDKGSQLITCVLVAATAILAWWAFIQVMGGSSPQIIDLMSWIDSGNLHVGWTLRVDPITAVMLVVVSTVSAMVHLYSVGYMQGDRSIPRFMAYLSLFTFSMLVLVTADNLLQLFFGWEAVGLSSYLLIGFWYEKPSANAAAIKAFVVNRVGDLAFAIGIIGIFLTFNSLDFSTIFASASAEAAKTVTFLGMEWPVIDTLSMLLFIGAMGKSAQIGLHVWLPDAMEGPTPVSALIHAATMVTAGVFLVCRLSPIFELSPVTLAVMTIIGATTAFFAATIALCQNDIKRVIAYSTCSQLGYMFFAAGVSAYDASMFHLFTHAFFKALLFLGAGSVIHALSGEQDLRKMGGIWRAIPITYVLMWIGSIALGGLGIPHIFGLAGFYSKDAILEAAWLSPDWTGQYAFWLGLLTALLTAFYSWRLLLMAFHGYNERRSEDAHHLPTDDHHSAGHHAHESSWIMLLPMMVLAVGAMIAGFYFYPYFLGEHAEAFWGQSIFLQHHLAEKEHHLPLWVVWAPTVAAVSGLIGAYLFYVVCPRLPNFFARAFRPIYKLFLNKWYFDELYHHIFIKPALKLADFFWRRIDQGIIDRFGPNGTAFVTRLIAAGASRLQSGYVYHYAFAVLIGLAVLLWIVLNRYMGWE
jgi:NADH-quinone oxidoreductase subunit L